LAGLFISGAYAYHAFIPFTLCAVLSFAMGLIDDKYTLGSKCRLLCQAAIALLFVLSSGIVLQDLGIFAIPFFLQIPFTVFAIVGIINAFNIIDGMNCLSSGLAIIATSSFGIVASFYGNIEVFILSMLLVGAILGFMVFNIRGKIFMGDSGSYFLGFVVSALSIILVTKTHAISPFFPLLAVFLPVFDTLFAIHRRHQLKKNPFEADRRHLHHMLARRYKSKTMAVMVMLILQAFVALLAILLHEHTYALVGIAILSAMFLRRLWYKRIRLRNVSPAIAWMTSVILKSVKQGGGFNLWM